jgi:outer membrane cobalamin receptor
MGMNGRPNWRVVAATVMAAWSIAASARAQDRFHQTVVVTGTTQPIELGEATRTLTVITREQIEALPVQSVADILRLASSVDVRARGVRGMQTDFAIRGATFGQMLVLVDGVRLNDAQSGHHNGDIPVPLEAIERIEVLYGPDPHQFAHVRRRPPADLPGYGNRDGVSEGRHGPALGG